MYWLPVYFGPFRYGPAMFRPAVFLDPNAYIWGIGQYGWGPVRCRSIRSTSCS